MNLIEMTQLDDDGDKLYPNQKWSQISSGSQNLSGVEVGWPAVLMPLRRKSLFTLAIDIFASDHCHIGPEINFA